MEDKPKRKVGRPANPERVGLPAIGTLTQKHIDKFWSKINKNGTVPAHAPELGACWEWQGGGNGHGYGQMRVNYSQVGTHKIAWELANGQIPAKLYVLHKCDNRACCNPGHLFLGTAKDNTIDMIQRGRKRARLGAPHHHVTNDEVLTIKSRYADGATKAALAREFNVSHNTVSNIVNGRTRNR